MTTGLAKMFAWVGGMSYSVYLIHPLVTKGLSYELFRSGYRNPWFTIAVVVPACLGCRSSRRGCFITWLKSRLAIRMTR